MAADVVPTELIERFQRDGFVVVADLLTAAELDTFGAAIDNGVSERKSSDGRSFEEKSRYEQSFIQCMNLWEDHPDVRGLTFHTRIAEVAATLLGVAGLRLWHDQALYKEPGGRPTDCHQDQPYWPIAETDTITAWVPLAGSTIASGAMAYLPGSHRSGVREYVHIFGRKDPPNLLEHPALAGVEPVTVEVPAGAVAFHHGLTVHLAHANLTDHTRRVHTMIYFADGSTRGNDRWHDSVERAGIKVGEVIASDVTPVVWPRDNGDPIAQPPPPLELPGFPGVLPSHLRN